MTEHTKPLQNGMYQSLELCVSTKKVVKIEETIKVVIDGYSHWIKIKEVWTDNIPEVLRKEGKEQIQMKESYLDLTDGEDQVLDVLDKNQNTTQLDKANEEELQGSDSENTHISFNIQETRVNNDNNSSEIHPGADKFAWEMRESINTESSKSSGLNALSLDQAYSKASLDSNVSKKNIDLLETGVSSKIANLSIGKKKGRPRKYQKKKFMLGPEVS